MMPEPVIQPDSLPVTTCRRCGQPVPPLALICRECGEMLVTTRLLRWERRHTGDIVFAVAAFLVTNLILFGITGGELWTALAVTLRLIFLGIPFAIVAWKWYRLMREFDPDYGLLWETYWTMQLLVWALALLLLLGLAVLLALISLVFVAFGK